MTRPGRPAIPRGAVESRAYWQYVAIGARDRDLAGKINPHSEESVSAHWYWFGKANGIVYSSWKPSGLSIERTLFAELRPEDWDSKPPYARMEQRCQADGCINPLHWEFKIGAASLTFEKALAIVPELEERPLPPEVGLGTYRDYALGAYITCAREMGKLLEARIIKPDGTFNRTVLAESETYAPYFLDADPILMAILATWLKERPLRPVADVMKERDKRRAAIRKQAKGRSIAELAKEALGE